jgi:transcriptional regulator with XRE-family HTH domain
MKKHSPADKAFIKAFAERLEAAKTRETSLPRNLSVEEFAHKLGVTRAALHKYVHGRARPGLDVLERAKTEFGVEVKYGEIDIPLIKRRAKHGQSDELQMLLPFAIESLKAEDIEIRIAEKKNSRITLSVAIRFAS